MERGLRPLTLSPSRIAGDRLRPGCGPGDVPGYPYIRITRSGPSRNGHGLLPAPDPRPICILPALRAPSHVSAALRQLLWYLIAGTRGGANRARILETLRERPHNAHQLSEVLCLDYRTVRHHLELLHRNGLLTR